MNFSSSQHIQQNMVLPVAESPHLPANTTPGSYAAYNAIQEEEIPKRNKNQNDSSQNSDQKDDKTVSSGRTPEIFNLLKKYRFKDFFRLYLGENESTLSVIIKRKRKSRGISRSSPISSGHKKSKEFINRITAQYLNSGWLMEGKPGKAYSGSL